MSKVVWIDKAAEVDLAEKRSTMSRSMEDGADGCDVWALGGVKATSFENGRAL